MQKYIFLTSTGPSSSRSGYLWTSALSRSLSRGPVDSPWSVCPSFCQSGCSFSQIFLTLCMMLEVNNCQKPTESDFLGKFLFGHILAKGADNGLRRGFILVFDKNCYFIFLKILTNERLHCYLLSFLNATSGKILVPKLFLKILLSNQNAGFFSKLSEFFTCS